MYQDVYLNLKHRWASYLVKEWREGTDPEKHVHEDLALAAWLMCLWRIKFGDPAYEREVTVGLKERPWLTNGQSWSRPPGGFVDVGCGNGLLVWLLNNEVSQKRSKLWYVSLLTCSASFTTGVSRARL
jgi:tRNASer (uridine44-2'-O)-methyltransferase